MENIYDKSPLESLVKEIHVQDLIKKYSNQNLFQRDIENEQIYLQTKSNYKDNGIYEDNETDD